jgi:multidrug efflux pump subunit AcrA (membrane-fusion protein)
MREETRRKLERALWRDRAKKIGIGVAALAAIGLFFVYEDYDAHIDNVRVPGTVVSVGPLNTTNTQAIENGLSVDVALENGRRVTVWVLKKTDPHVGDHVQITEHRHRTGRVNYSWK